MKKLQFIIYIFCLLPLSIVAQKTSAEELTEIKKLFTTTGDKVNCTIMKWFDETSEKPKGNIVCGATFETFSKDITQQLNKEITNSIEKNKKILRDKLDKSNYSTLLEQLINESFAIVNSDKITNKREGKDQERLNKQLIEIKENSVKTLDQNILNLSTKPKAEPIIDTTEKPSKQPENKTPEEEDSSPNWLMWLPFLSLALLGFLFYFFNKKIKALEEAINDFKKDQQNNTTNEVINTLKQKVLKLEKNIRNNTDSITLLKPSYIEKPKGVHIVSPQEPIIPVPIENRIKPQIYYFETPNSDGTFDDNIKESIASASSIFQLTIDTNNSKKGKLKIIDKAAIHERIIDNYRPNLEPISDYDFSRFDNRNTTKITVITPATLELQGNKWVVKTKMKIKPS